jgi:hypothetical protein
MGCNCKKRIRQEPKVITSIPQPTPTPEDKKQVEEPKQEN